MAKQNCWEFMRCGREPGGEKVKDLGVCPAAVEIKADGVNGGKNGGRACWAISGTFCEGKVQGTFAQKLCKCIKCMFYKKVVAEEGPNFMISSKIKEIIEKADAETPVRHSPAPRRIEEGNPPSPE